MFKKGYTPWNKGLRGEKTSFFGKHHSEITKNKIREAFSKSGSQKEENNPAWKGINAGYRAKHRWVIKQKGYPVECNHCGLVGKKEIKWNIDWANISGEYLRDLTDWIGLCRSCHIKFDRSYLKRKRDFKGKFI